MKDDLMENELEKTEVDPRRFDPRFSYGILPEQPRPEDLLYRLSYDPDRSYLLLNGFVVQTFKWESNADNSLRKLFEQEGTVKAVDVIHPANATIIVNNIKMPLSLRNAFFRTGNDGHRMQVTTEINRDRAKKYNIRKIEVENYINKSRNTHYRLLDTNKRK